ncbi:leucine-rich repeat domain-containing protein [Arsenicibacter rosenii]|uniref:Leucine-rich repeat domain-containing protein n=1 Tax=Arsenicibacter rosenii TaxID=1750698 RepID=A0A1S2VHN2_9BACT|nr:leucine-rich repeat domain-containing protein [Arsenicibacter rosenii]OIN58239.1 hypothetical protein BLX24_14620 [Arsenicibacter rosenii]
MMNSLPSCPPHADTVARRYTWWINLTPLWRAAFQQVVFNHNESPADEDLCKIWQSPALRFAGPRAPYPNMTFELTDCSGLTGLTNLETLVVMNHRLEGVPELSTLTNLKSLFVNNNLLTSLAGIESLNQLELLYAHINRLQTLAPLRSLTRLRELYVCYNALTSLEGLTSAHAKQLKKLVCLPNDGLPDREIIRVEQRLGIRCQRM